MYKTSFLFIIFIIGVIALTLASCDSDSVSSSSDDSVWKVKKDSRQIAEDFLINSPTFKYDGIEESIEQALEPEAAGVETWRFLFSFSCEHEGYGDLANRSNEQLTEKKKTYHEALITVTEGEVIRAVIDNNWDMIDQEESSDWGWGEAGKQALYGLISVFTILIMLTILTRISGSIISRMEKRNTSGIK